MAHKTQEKPRKSFVSPLLKILLFLAITPAYAQIDVGGIRVPINKPKSILDATPSCSDLDANKKNIIYIDDTGAYPKRSDNSLGTHRNLVNGGSDPNGFQDLVIVLAFGNYYSLTRNLVGVGTTNNSDEDYRLVRKIVDKFNNSSGLEVPAWSASQIYARVNFYAHCPQISPSNKLAIGIGGEFNKIGRLLGENFVSAGDDEIKIRDRIEVAGLAGLTARLDDGYNHIHNTRNCGDNQSPCPYYDGNPWLGYGDVYGHIFSQEYYNNPNHPSNALQIFEDPTFREPYLLTSADPDDWDTASEVNSLYVNYIRKGLIGIEDDRGFEITNSSQNSVYENHLRPLELNGSVLKIADYLSVAIFIWPNDRDRITTKAFIYPKIIAAINASYD